MSKKVLNTQAVINELKGQSAFFRSGSVSQQADHKDPSPAAEKPVEQKKRKQARKQGNKETRKLVNKQPNQQTRQEASLQPSEPSKPEYYRKQTFEFTEGELFFLDDVKLASKREYGFKTTKNEIVRTALEFLRKDFEINKETSFLVRKFTNKETR